MNKCIFTGRVVRNPEAKMRKRKKDDSKFLVVTFTLAVGDDDDTDFLNFKIMNASAETFKQYVKKGMKIIISDSRAKYERYTVDGEEKEKVIFTVYQWEFAESKRKKNSSDYDDDDDYIEEDYQDSEDESDEDDELTETSSNQKMQVHISKLIQPKKNSFELPNQKALWDGFTNEERLFLYEQGYSKDYIDNYEKIQMSSIEGQKEMLEFRRQVQSTKGFVSAEDADVPFKS